MHKAPGVILPAGGQLAGREQGLGAFHAEVGVERIERQSPFDEFQCGRVIALPASQRCQVAERKQRSGIERQRALEGNDGFAVLVQVEERNAEVFPGRRTAGIEGKCALVVSDGFRKLAVGLCHHAQVIVVLGHPRRDAGGTTEIAE